MADAVQPDVKPAPASSAPATQTTQAQPPATEKVVAGGTENQHVPYSRFQEVVKVKNEYASRLEELEKRLSTHDAIIGQTAKKDIPSKHVEKLVAAGMDRGVAELLVETSAGLAKESVSDVVEPLKQATISQQVQSWTEKFKQSHKDYDELEPEMVKVFEAMPPRTQDLIVSDPKGLELIYAHVKMQRLEDEKNKSFQAGAQAAYDSKGLKAALSSTAGATTNPNVGLTRNEIAGMSLKEYEARRAEILKSLQNK